MTDFALLKSKWATFKAGTLWAQYAKFNPGEAQNLDAYVASIVTGAVPTPPHLATNTGVGLEGIFLAFVGLPVSTAVAAPGSTGQAITTVPYTTGIAFNVQQSNTDAHDIAIDDGSGDSAILLGSGGRWISGVTLERIRVRKAAIGNTATYGKHCIYMDCFNSTLTDLDLQGSQYAADGLSIRMGGIHVARATISGCYFPIGIFDSDSGQSDGTVLLEDITGTFANDTAIWADVNSSYKSSYDLKLTMRRCQMTGPGAFLKVSAARSAKATFAFESCTLNGKPLTSADVPSGSVIT